MNDQLFHYYSERASEYDAIYDKPERQVDLSRLSIDIPALLRVNRLLELACGTGYWTAKLAQVAKEVVATDASPNVLDRATERLRPYSNVKLQCEDAFCLRALPNHFEAVFAGFWYSHIHRLQLPDFFHNLHRKLLPGGRVVMLDNRYVEGSSTPISRVDSDGNSWQQRQLKRTTQSFEILKNFPDATTFAHYLPTAVKDLQFIETQYYWYASYRTAD